MARKLHLVRVPETSLLAAVLMLEIGLWCVVLVTLLPYHYCCVGPAELWDRTDGFLGYTFAFLMEGVHYPACRRGMYFFPAMVFLIGGAPYLIFKVPSTVCTTKLGLGMTMRFPMPVPCMHYACTVHASPLQGAPARPGPLWAAERLRLRPAGQRARRDDGRGERAQIQARAAHRVQKGPGSGRA